MLSRREAFWTQVLTALRTRNGATVHRIHSSTDHTPCNWWRIVGRSRLRVVCQFIVSDLFSSMVVGLTRAFPAAINGLASTSTCRCSTRCTVNRSIVWSSRRVNYVTVRSCRYFNSTSSSGTVTSSTPVVSSVHSYLVGCDDGTGHGKFLGQGMNIRGCSSVTKICPGSSSQRIEYT